jgi:glycosyltransferase involved in cell wall biosynthesis
MSVPALSVIIPSFYRRSTLEMVLEGLEHQTLANFEVIVVLDGSTDDSIEMLADWQRQGRLPELTWHRQSRSGQAAARNTGARMARGQVLVFLDDDVVPDPGLLKAHLRHHRAGVPIAVLGEAAVVRERRESFYHLGVWAWWEDTYQARALPGRVPGCRDLCAGNFSIRRSDFLEAGGFDPRFKGYGGEDYELGWRLLRRGVRLVSDRKARARHFHRTTVEGVLRASRQEAHGDFLIGDLHPELRPGLRFSRFPPGPFGRYVRLALTAPALADALASAARNLLPLLERFQFRRRWLWVFNTLRGYAYWQGVRDVFGTNKALEAYQLANPPLPHQRIDLEGGLPARLPDFWVDGSSRVELAYAGQPVGELELVGPTFGPVHERLALEISEQFSRPALALMARENPEILPDFRWILEEAGEQAKP